MSAAHTKPFHTSGALQTSSANTASNPPRGTAAIPQFLWPREHGAWGMVLLPFLSACILARGGGWPVIAALAAVLAAFLVREPLLVLLRQRYRWSQPRAETPAARRSLALLSPILALSGFSLAFSIPILPLMALGALATALMTLYLWGAMNNRQRSPWLQAAGAVGLSASAPLAYLAAGRHLDQIVVLLWAAHSVHGIASVLVIHARLDAIAAHKRGSPIASPPPACRITQAGAALFALLLAISGFPALGVAIAVPVLIHALDLRRLADPSFLRMKLQRVGLGELAISTVFSVAVVVALW